MKIKLDENIPVDLKAILSRLGHDTDTVIDEGLAGRPDPKIWEETQKAGRFLITQDVKFVDAKSFPAGTHQGVLLLRLFEPNRRLIVEKVESCFRNEDISAWQMAIVVVTDQRVRVRQK